MLQRGEDQGNAKSVLSIVGLALYDAGGGNMLAFPEAKSRAEIKKIFGIESIDTGGLGGILIGLIAATLFNRYYRFEVGT